MAAPGAYARPPMPETAPPERPDDRVPVFGTWRAIHAAVAVCALAVMALLALFSRWPF
jgi:anti-sigma-K factor RskA